MIDRFRPFSAVHLFLIKDNQVLLARRFQTGYQDGNYSVPAGHLDGNETATQAIIREAQEEVGITITTADVRFVHVMHRTGDRESIDFFFVCEHWTGEPTIMEPDKCDELVWSKLDHLPSNTIPYISQALQNYQHNQSFSEFGW